MKQPFSLAVLLFIAAFTQAQSWSLTGNAGTNPATNFLGTTDNQPLKFRINNVYSGMLSAQNIFLGKNSGLNNTSYGNIAIGNGALFTNIGQSRQIAIGDSALYKSVTGPAIDAGTKNIAIGSKTLYNNFDGSNNTVIGFEAGYTTTGNGVGDGYNTIIGSEAMHTPLGQWNTAVGYRVLYAGASSVYNTGVGYAALYSSSGAWNTAIGSAALQLSTSGAQNTAAGSNVLLSNTTGSNNTAVGFSSLRSNSTGYSNVSVGVFAMYFSKNRHNVVAVGDSALYNNGSSTSFTGSEGSYNTGLGPKSLFNNTNGYSNTAVGYRSLFTNTTGFGNTAVGSSAYPISATVNNYTGIGYGVGNGSSVSNSVELGNSSVSWIGGQVGWSTYSDGRIKENVLEDVKGLEFIQKLRPVTYTLNIHRQNELLQGRLKGEDNEWPEKYEIEKNRVSGFIAQEVEEAARQINFQFSGIRKPQNPQALYSLTYSDFVVPLVKAVQEQQAIIEKLTKRIEDLEKKSLNY